MMPLALAVLMVGADPAPCISGYCPPRTPPRWFPKRAAEQMKEKADALQYVGKVPPGGPSFLYQPAFAEDEIIRLPARPYELKPGDIAFSTDTSRLWLRLHNLAGTSHPTHSMVVFEMPDGRTAILEGGPHDTALCRILETVPHLASYEAEGRVWVRRRKCPLTPMQSALLTEFCLSANCRNFSMRRLALQLTPLRSRGPIKTVFMGKPRGLDREGYFCSDLICEALVYAGLMNAQTTRPGATYPRDLFFGTSKISKNPWLHFHLPEMNQSWDAPARWTGSPIVSTGK
jgi:hypothetical protein